MYKVEEKDQASDTDTYRLMAPRYTGKMDIASANGTITPSSGDWESDALTGSVFGTRYSEAYVKEGATTNERKQAMIMNDLVVQITEGETTTWHQNVQGIYYNHANSSYYYYDTANHQVPAGATFSAVVMFGYSENDVTEPLSMSL